MIWLSLMVCLLLKITFILFILSALYRYLGINMTIFVLYHMFYVVMAIVSMLWNYEPPCPHLLGNVYIVTNNSGYQILWYDIQIGFFSWWLLGTCFMTWVMYYFP